MMKSITKTAAISLVLVLSQPAINARANQAGLPVQPVGSDAQLKKLTRLMEKARLAMVAKNYKVAIRIYTKVLQSPESIYHKEAQEYLGLARERNGQLAHAKAEYRIYLTKYPQGEAADRVRQRLEALITASLAPMPGLPRFSTAQRQQQWQFFGNLMQYYDRDVINTGQLGEVVANSIVATNFNHAGNLRNSRYKMKTNFSVVHTYDLQDSNNDDLRINTMYFDMVTPDRSVDSRSGRQKGRSNGVVGRFDGVDLGYRMSSDYKLRLVTGIPFETSETVEKRSDKYFYSLGVEIGPFRKNWDASVYAIQQMADELVDRQEVGAELRYRSKNESLFTLFDYSTVFSTVNYFTTVYNRRFSDKTSLDIIADYRKSPFLTTTNALQGQIGVSSLNDLLSSLDEDEIEQLSLDRTALYRSFTVLYGKPVSDRLELNADLSLSNLSGTVASGGVDATEGTGNEYSGSVGFIANNVFVSNDINIGSFRMSRFVSSDVMVLSLASKYRVAKQWRLNPRFRYENRNYDDGRDIVKFSPSIRLNYRQNRRWQFDLDVEYEDRETTQPGQPDENESSYTIHAGYVYSFQ